jgi:hypothetical protein
LVPGVLREGGSGQRKLVEEGHGPVGGLNEGRLVGRGSGLVFLRVGRFEEVSDEQFDTLDGVLE